MKIYKFLCLVLLILFASISFSCIDYTDDMFGIENMFIVTFYNETEKDIEVVYSVCDRSYEESYANTVSVEAGKEEHEFLWLYPKGTPEDTLTSGIASIEIAIEGESYKACGWPEGADGFPDVSEYSDYGLCYVNHPITRDSLCYTQIGGTTTSYPVDTHKSGGIPAVARIKANDDGSLYIEWSLE